MKKLLILTLALGSMAVISAPMALAQAPAAQAPAAQAPAAAKPNFTGSWKLDLSQSVYGPVPSPNSETNEITQTGDDFKLVMTQEGGAGNGTFTISLTIGGPETTLGKDASPANSDLTILTTKADWQGAVLVIVQRANYQGMGVAISARFTLSDDGKTLTKLTNYSTDQGDFDTKTVYTKI